MQPSSLVQVSQDHGLSVEETAEVLGVAPDTVTRDWNFARAWLRHELGGAEDRENGTLAAN
jgi:DNA-directed RNA polymerase specialized sigma24 family protein